jgi:subtilisin family serine protease
MPLISRSAVGRITLVSSLLLAVQLPGAPVPGGRRAAPSFRPGVVLVKLRSGASTESAQVLFRARGAASSRRFKRPRTLPASAVDRWWRVNLTPGQDARAALSQLVANPLVETAEMDARISIASLPDDPGFSQLWGLNNTGQTGGTADADVDAPEAWNIETGTGVMVGVIDTGIDYTHPDLAANVWTNPLEIPGNGIDDDNNGYVDDVHGYDFVNRDGDPMDDHGHGTHVAGTIAAVANNGIGVAGVSWHAKVMALKFLDAGGYGYASDAVDALNYATDMGAKITNNSWGGGEYSTALRDAIAAANSAGAVFVAAAGNYSSNNDTTPFYPAGYEGPNVIVVAATDSNDGLASFSNFGRKTVLLGAPGVGIYSTVPAVGASCCSSPTRYATLSGTSMAAPHVSGAAALLISHYPGLTPAQVRQRLAFSGDTVPALTSTTVSGRRLSLVGMLEQDDVPPDATADFRVLTHSSRSVRLGWTATGDDGSGGLAASYELRYSTAPITAGNFGAATLAPSLPPPAVPGVAESVTITGLAFSTRYYFALRVPRQCRQREPARHRRRPDRRRGRGLPGRHGARPGRLDHLRLGRNGRTRLVAPLAAPVPQSGKRAVLRPRGDAHLRHRRRQLRRDPVPLDRPDQPHRDLALLLAFPGEGRHEQLRRGPRLGLAGRRRKLDRRHVVHGEHSSGHDGSQPRPVRLRRPGDPSSLRAQHRRRRPQQLRRMGDRRRHGFRRCDRRAARGRCRSRPDGRGGRPAHTGRIGLVRSRRRSNHLRVEKRRRRHRGHEPGRVPDRARQRHHVHHCASRTTTATAHPTASPSR